MHDVGAATVTLPGRARDETWLLDVVRAAVAGAPQAVLVRGETGVGKTALVRGVAEKARLDGVRVLWGRALSFGAVESMYHPIVLALEAWLTEPGEAERVSMVKDVPGAALLLPSLGAAEPLTQLPLVTVVNALIGRVVSQGPTLIVVDDVQWADPATWDALSYLVAGFDRQPLALLATCRDESVGTEAFQHWLANLRRLPETRELALNRLGRTDTEDQIARLLGHPPPSRLVDQVYARSQGNPYFTELLVRRGDLGTPELPENLPNELSAALLDAWRLLGSQARELTRILAVAGRPSHLQVLSGLAEELGISGPGAVHEAVDAGVVVVGGQEVWFRHPLLADVLVGTYLPGEAAPVHAAWARRLDATTADGVDELRRLGDLATHHERAGAAALAFDVLLRGADQARYLGAHLEAAILLTRAADLWSEGAPDLRDQIAQARLLERAGRACRAVALTREAYRLLGQAQILVDPAREPLWASRLAVAFTGLAWELGETDDRGIDVLKTAVEISRRDPDSPEHAEAIGALAYELLWSGPADEASRVSDEAIAVAHRSGCAASISTAYGTRSGLALDSNLVQADRDAITSWEYALASGDAEVIESSFIKTLWVREATGDLLAVHAHIRDMYEWSKGLGAEAALFPAVVMTGVLLDMGELTAADEVVRGGLASRGNPTREAMIRLAAAQLSVRRGADDAARDHLARAREIMPHLDERSELVAGPPLAEVLVALRQPDAAFELVERVLPLNAVDPRVLDWLLLHGARATAELVQEAVDARDEATAHHHRQALGRLVCARADLPGTAFRRAGDRDFVQRARAALFQAEVSQVEGQPDTVERWREAAAACAEAGMTWEQHRSSWRLASAILETGTRSTEVGDLLRGVQRFAVQQRAERLRCSVQELAELARISLAEPRQQPPSAVKPTAFARLTARESEVLSHLVADRTYAEIAFALVISEKTVSAHVSNVLRKTGTGSRREVAALARRARWGTGG